LTGSSATKGSKRNQSEAQTSSRDYDGSFHWQRKAVGSTDEKRKTFSKWTIAVSPKPV
jgi:hypothetical protein